MIQKYFSGRKCAEYDRKGSIVQENVYNCSNSIVSCPNVYKSTDAYKYQSCYDGVEQRKEVTTTTESTNSNFESPDETNIIIELPVLIVIIVGFVTIVVAEVAVIVFYKFKMKKYSMYNNPVQFSV